MRHAALLVILTTIVLAVGGCRSRNSTLPEPAPEPVPAARPDAPPPVQHTYVGNTRSKVFHRDDCPELESVDLSRRRLLETPGTALDEGYSPCPVCKPLRGWSD